MTNSLTSTLIPIALEVSLVVKPRTKEKVYLHLLSEIGELAEEANIANGDLYKEAGPDGIAGEAADVINCIADLIWVCCLSELAFKEAVRLIALHINPANFDATTGWPAFPDAKTNFTKATTELAQIYGLTQDSRLIHNSANIQAISCILGAVLALVKSNDPNISEAEFIRIFKTKCDKWLKQAS